MSKKKWTIEQDYWLIDNFEHCDMKELCEFLKRGHFSILNRAKLLRIGETERLMNLHTLQVDPCPYMAG